MNINNLNNHITNIRGSSSNSNQVRRDKYLEYIKEHKSNVVFAFGLIEEALNNQSEINIDLTDIKPLIWIHDESKYTFEEFGGYLDYFYPKNGEAKNEDNEEEFDKSWLIHQRRNPHHWQYWVLTKDNGKEKCIKMDINYVIELMADWMSFSVKVGKIEELKIFYDKNPHMKFHPETKALIESLIDLLLEKYKGVDIKNPYYIKGDE